MEWSETTQATYFACLLTTMHLIGIQKSVAEELKMKRLQDEAARAPHWNFSDGTQVLTAERIASLKSLAKETNPSSPMNAALLTLTLGQRMGDVLKLNIENLLWMQGHVIVQFKEGKTIPRMKPYSLMVEADSEIGNLLTNISIEAQSQGKLNGRIFPANSEEVFKNQFTKIDVRALRRTGLILMGISGATQDQLLMASRHSSKEMLNLYLNHGMFNLRALKEFAQVVTSTESTPMPHICKPCEATAVMEHLGKEMRIGRSTSSV
jgi:integrase